MSQYIDFPKFSLAVCTDAEWRNMSISERYLHVLAGMQANGVEEFPKGTNWNTKPDNWLVKILRTAGINYPAPWCMAIVYFALIKSGADPKKLWSEHASTLSAILWARRNNKTKKWPVRGLCAIYYNKTIGGGHAMPITIVNEGMGEVYTIEGNTNSDGGREGWKLLRKIRKISWLSKQPTISYVSFEGCEL